MVVIKVVFKTELAVISKLKDITGWPAEEVVRTIFNIILSTMLALNSASHL